MYVKYEGKVLGHITTNRSLTTEEALDLIGIDESQYNGQDAEYDFDRFDLDSEELPGTISTDNGLSECEPEEAIKELAWDVIVNAMDDDVREQVHGKVAPCTNLEFLVAYLATGNSIVIG